MKPIKYFLLSTFLLFLFLSGCKQQASKNFLFDFGNPDASHGYSGVTSENKYTKELGFGLVTNAKNFGAFSQSYVKTSDPLLQNGLQSEDSLVFRVDADPGEYLLLIPVGGGENPAVDMKIFLNETVLSDSITTPWLSLPYRTFSSKIYLEGPADFTFVSRNERPVAIHGIELRAITDTEKLDLPTLLDQDTAEIQALKEELASSTQDLTSENLLDDLDKYLKACYYYDIGWWSWAVKESGMSIFPRYHMASDLLRQITANEDHPLFDKSAYLIARIHYWLYKEQGNEYNREQYEEYFELLHNKYPEHPILSMYYGESIPADDACVSTDEYAPVWANYQREAICRMRGMTHWWADSVQAENGELGGKFGDDVEILRWWLPVILGADDQKSREAYTRLVNGVWNSGLLERAFSKKVEDVEHSAELFRDTHPAMFLMNYGNPIYVERCLVSMQNFRDTWTGINDYGHRHFKSCYLSATEVDERPPYAVDVPLNARATLPMLWAAWYNQNPTTIKLFTEWGYAWVEDTEREENGKPAGIMPAAISYKEDKIGGYAPHWFDPGEGLGWEYFDWVSLGHLAEMYNQLLGMYSITGDELLLNPMNSTFEFMMQNKDSPVIAETTQGSADWVAAHLWGKTEDGLKPNDGMMKLYGSGRSLIGTDEYDDLIAQAGRHYSRYRVTGEEKHIVEGLEEILGTIRYNLPLFTTEVKFTDRVYIPNDDLLFGMYTGHIGSGFEFPGLSATWSNTGTDVAVLVGETSRRELNVQLYNFGENKQIGLYTWQLEPGKYQMTLKRKEDGSIITSKPLEISERTSYTPFEVYSRELIDLKITQVEAYENLTFPRVDVALTQENIIIEKADDANISISVTIHNIGNKDARSVEVSVKDESGQLIVNKQIPAILAPNDLDPKTKKVQFNLPAEIRGKKVTISAKVNEPEITRLNNEIQYVIE